MQTYKHKTPVIPYEQRKAIVEAIRYVDEVVPQENMDKFAAWEKYHFDAIFHGDDWKGSDMYIIDTGAAWFAQNKANLKEAVLTILSDEVERSRVLGVARSVAEKNHSIEKNRETFVNAINNMLESSEMYNKTC